MADTSVDLRRSIEADDLEAAEKIALRGPALLNCDKGQPLLSRARSVAMAERLIAAGGKIESITKWWGPGFGVRGVEPAVGRYFVERGAALTIHAASALGLIDELKTLLDSHPALIDAKGGDGCTPLHFARDVPTAQFLVQRGAPLDARDDDHGSTPAQWLIGDAPEVSRWLLEQGAASDIFHAAALGDRALAGRLIAANSSCLSRRIGKLPDFPPLGSKPPGGTIYQWTLGFNSYSHQIALKKGHLDLFDFFFEKSDTTTRFLVSCVLARREQAQSILSKNPGLVSSLASVDLELLPRYCWETNLDYHAVKLMLDLGFPVSHPEHSHGYTPLHNAAWAGAADLVELLLERGHPTDIVDPRFQTTPLVWALHDCLIEQRHPEGEFVRVVKLLIDAGSPLNDVRYPTGHADIDAVLTRLGGFDSSKNYFLCASG
jgi:ankyrin repeat protein